ncbi:MAG: SUMF1/EgtB/PvdO family nonheme iron enzyme [Myxococcales bacterium]|nr:SUMF1/EgtB/PvdO family nonheme iron enzyme [Myxococcales bacterium]
MHGWIDWLQSYLTELVELLSRVDGVAGGITVLGVLIAWLGRSLLRAKRSYGGRSTKRTDWWLAYHDNRKKRIGMALEWFTPLDIEVPANTPEQQPVIYDSLNSVTHDVAQPILLLGEPGAGKSTLLANFERHIFNTSNQRKDSEMMVPILFELNTFSEVSPSDTGKKGLRNWLRATWREDILPYGVEAPELDALLEAGHVWLLFDALNEMPYKSQDPAGKFYDFAELIRNLPPGNRVIISCRTRDVQGELNAVRAYIQPLRPEGMRRYLELACQKKNVPDASVLRILETLESQTALNLYQNPFRLSLLAQMVRDHGTLPRNQAELFSYTFREAIRREQHKPECWARMLPLLSQDDLRFLHQENQIPPPFAPNQGPLLPNLGQLAFSNQKLGMKTVVAESDALRSLEPLGVELLEAGLALGILSNHRFRGERHWRFVHQQYQEYFSARTWLVENPRDFARAYRPYLRSQLSDSVPLEDIIANLAADESIPERRRSGWEETAAIALQLASTDIDFVIGLSEVAPIQVAQWALDENSNISEKIKEGLRGILVQWINNPNVDLRARIEAGLSLDTPVALNFQQGESPEGHPYFLPPFVSIQAGVYNLGENSALNETRSHLEPQIFRLESPLMVGKYPVSRAEFSCFIDAGGYNDMRWWPEGTLRRAWRDGLIHCDDAAHHGAQHILDRDPRQFERYFDARLRTFSHFEHAVGFRQSILFVRELSIWSESFLDEFSTDNQWKPDEIDTLRKVRTMSQKLAVDIVYESGLYKLFHPGRLGRPLRWKYHRYSRPLQALVGVCSFEANAYLAWLSWATGYNVRLPIENEWEVAARGVQSRTWAYGDSFSMLRCNTSEGRQRMVTPICSYLDGQTPDGIFDLSGNVEEWTSSPWQPNADEDHDLKLVVRGGSRKRGKEWAKCSHRANYRPGNQHGGAGFRLFSSDSPR